MVKNSIELWVYTAASREFLLLEVTTPEGRFWQPITGGIEAGETAVAAACRELQEETGISASEAELMVLGAQTVVLDASLTIAKKVFLLMVTDKPQVVISREHTDHQWCSPAETAKELYWPNNRETLNWALNKIEMEQN